MLSLEELFCSVDDFCQSFEPHWKQQLLGVGLQRRNGYVSQNLAKQLLKTALNPISG